MTRNLVFALLAALPMAWAAPAGAGELRPWNQEEVTALAEKLAEQLSGLRELNRKTPPDTVASGQAAARHRLTDGMRALERESKTLAAELAAGKGREQTLELFNRIDLRRVRIAEEARRMFLSQEAIDKIQSGRGTLEEMRAYYTGEDVPVPDLHGPKRSEGKDAAGEAQDAQ